MPDAFCALCTLPCGPEPLTGRIRDTEKPFCCPGCLNVYTILIESGIVSGGQDFRDTDLYRRSLELGLVARPAGTAPAAPIPPSAERREALFQISGMWCSSCAWLIERALKAERGVVSADVLFASDLVKVSYCPQFLPPDKIARVIDSLGYKADEYRGADGRRQDKVRNDLLLRMGLAAFLWMNVMYLSAIVYVGYFEATNESAGRIVPFILMLLAAPAVFWSAKPILRAAWLGLRQRILRADTLLALGIVAAYVYSTLQAFTGGRLVYFDTSCAIVTLVLAGKLLEHGAKQKTAQAVALLHRMMPKKARVLVDGGERFVAVEALQPGTLFLVKSGERVPADGIIAEGESHVDESVLTGESAPVSKSPGAFVVCGSLNTGNVLHVKATRTAASSTLSQIIRSVESALASRSGIERTADRISRAFVPAVVILAIFTFIALSVLRGQPGEAMVRAIAVLVIACPCALGIATPLALTAAVNAASRKGILINDVSVLETICDVSVVLLDKTGTVTEGEFRLLETSGDSLAPAASLEAKSEHPLGRAVVAYARERQTPLADARGVEVVKGMGIRGMVEGREVFAGSRRFVPAIPPALSSVADAWEARGDTVAFYGWDGRVRGALAFGDKTRPDAAGLVHELSRRGIGVMMVSGDSRTTTAGVARAIGVPEFRAEVLPGEKAGVVRGLQSEGKVVAMVGDGVNDAPALAQANLGIAMGSGADLAMKAAPMVLMGTSLLRILDAFDLSRRTLRIVRQNLFWAFVYNILGISLAISGILNPILAAVAMVLSSFSVILNSLRAR
jgi:heavy metal translocating P-type ATPase